MSVRLLIADDQELIRDGLASILDDHPELQVVGRVADGREAVRMARELRPDVTLMDIRMPILDGLGATQQLLLDDPPPTRVVVLTTFDDDDLVIRALQAGASGFLLKDLPRHRLVESVLAVHAGELQLSPSITRRLAERHLHRRTPSDAGEVVQLLTPREVEILELIARGATNTEIAAGLFLSESTVKTHVGSLLHKLGKRDRVQLVIFAYDAGLVP
jgi:DNA-binding NarL/FixJ family response regulator